MPRTVPIDGIPIYPAMSVLAFRGSKSHMKRMVM